MVARDAVVEASAVAGWSEGLEDLHRRVAHRFARSEARERAKRYLVGLLGRLERKNGFYEKGILVKSRRGGGERPRRTSTTAPLRLLLSAFALGRLSPRPDA
jgi:hypothetical protein